MHVFPNDKVYIGITSCKVEKRFGKNGLHYLHKTKNGEYMQPKIARAIVKYGWENISHEILYENLSKEEAENFEKQLIVKYNSIKNGYNIQKGGHVHSVSEETKQKISTSLKGKFTGEKHHLYGTHLSDEHKRKISEANKGKIMSRESIEKTRAANIGRIHTEEARKHMSQAHIGILSGERHPMFGKTHTEEAREKIRQANLGKIMSDETKQKLRDANSGQKSPMYGRFGKNHPAYGCKRSDEERKRLSEIAKQRIGVLSNKAKKVNQYTKDGQFIKTWDYIKQAAEELCINAAHISACCRGVENRKTAGGFKWAYYNEQFTQ